MVYFTSRFDFEAWRLNLLDVLPKTQREHSFRMSPGSKESKHGK